MVTAPIPAVVSSSKMNVTGHVFLAVGTASNACPPDLSASNAVEILQNSSIVQPITNEYGILSFQPKDILSNVTTDDNTTIANLDLLNVRLAYTGNQRLADGAVILATSSPTEALQAAKPLCAQLLWREGSLDFASFLGPRWSNITDVAFNRTINVGASIKRDGDKVSDITLAMRNATMLLNITPEGTPGVEQTRATFLLSGNVVATAKLSEVDSWIEMQPADLDWSTVKRMDSPYLLGTKKKPKNRFIGINDTAPQECSVAESPAAALSQTQPVAKSAAGSLPCTSVWYTVVCSLTGAIMLMASGL
eukprot:gene9002-9175_t